MINEELLQYIRTELNRGVEKDALEKILIDTGWSKEDVLTAMNAVFTVATNPAQVTSPLAQSTTRGVGQSIQSRSKKGLIVFLLTLFVLFIVGGVFAYTVFFKKPTAEEVVKNMLLRLAEVNTFEYQIALNATGSTCSNYSYRDESVTVICNQRNPFSNTSTLSGVADITDVNNPQHRTVFSFKNSLQDGKSASVGGELRSVNKELYFKVSNLSVPQLDTLEIKSFLDTWINVNIASLQRDILGTDPSQNKQFLSQEQITRIKDLAMSSTVLTITQTFPNETLAGADMYHYGFEVSPDTQVQIVRELYKILYGIEISGDLEMMLAENVKEIKSIRGEIWLGTKDFLPYKLSFIVEPVDTDAYAIDNATIVLTFANYNKLVEVDAPANTRSFEDVMQEFFAPQQLETTIVIPKR